MYFRTLLIAALLAASAECLRNGARGSRKESLDLSGISRHRSLKMGMTMTATSPPVDPPTMAPVSAAPFAAASILPSGSSFPSSAPSDLPSVHLGSKKGSSTDEEMV